MVYPHLDCRVSSNRPALAEWELDPASEALHARRPAAARTIEERILVRPPLQSGRLAKQPANGLFDVSVRGINRSFKRLFSRGLAVLDSLSTPKQWCL